MLPSMAVWSDAPSVLALGCQQHVQQVFQHPMPFLAQAALDAAGEGLLADFLRASAHTSRLADAALPEAAARSAPLRQRAAAPPAGKAAGLAGAAAPAAAGAVCSARSAAAGGAAQREPWSGAAYDAAELQPVKLPQVLRTRVVRGASRGRRQPLQPPGAGWLAGLLAGSAVAALPDDAVRAQALAAAAVPPQQARQGAPPQSPRRPSAQQRTLGAALGGRRFGREIAAARASQQHHSEDGAEAETEAARYAALLAELPPLRRPLSGGGGGSGRAGLQEPEAAAVQPAGARALGPTAPPSSAVAAVAAPTACGPLPPAAAAAPFCRDAVLASPPPARLLESALLLSSCLHGPGTYLGV